MTGDKRIFNELQRQKRYIKMVLDLNILSIAGRVELIQEVKKIEVKIKCELDKNCGVIL